MSNTTRNKILITGATGQVGGKTIDFLSTNPNVELVAAIRNHSKSETFLARGIRTVLLDFDDESTHKNALEGIDTIFIVTGYSVDMLRQSKVLLDAAKTEGVKHVVHLGACGGNDTKIGHWVWHQLIERYIEWSGFSFTNLRPENFMQNLLSYGGKKAVENGKIIGFIDQARISWVDADDVAQVAALSLADPQIHSGKTYRMGYDAASFSEIAALMKSNIGQNFEYTPLSPEVFLENMKNSGAEMAYMNCVYDHWKRYAAGTIPGADEVFDNFFDITGNKPVKWTDFILKHKEKLAY